MRYQEENNVRYFDLHVHGLHSVPIRLERNSGLCVCVLEVPGLAKSRPSVLKGDHLYTKESGVIAARSSTRAWSSSWARGPYPTPLGLLHHFP